MQPKFRTIYLVVSAKFVKLPAWNLAGCTLYPAFLRLFAITLFAGLNLAFQCSEPCEKFYRGDGELSVSTFLPTSPFRIGDTLWFTADFPALLTESPRRVALSEAGGLVTMEAFALVADSSLAISASNAFSFVPEIGFRLPSQPEDPNVIFFRYACPAGRCSFRFGMEITALGNYALQLTGSAYDVANVNFAICEQTRFQSTKIEGAPLLRNGSFPLPVTYTAPSGRTVVLGHEFDQQTIIVQVP
ncbi:hypothetical protein [Lewinella sp. W8]|uniref:hypothetical protein n=1 Tax=Lewinella sp. W8 TaxID=2528208 RepID=UPI001068C93D|nr:hypothetical protein [Lewinella sp. W8]MTB51588.1 hypothetical protein [Lewinella sp. W8]